MAPCELLDLDLATSIDPTARFDEETSGPPEGDGCWYAGDHDVVTSLSVTTVGPTSSLSDVGDMFQLLTSTTAGQWSDTEIRELSLGDGGQMQLFPDDRGVAVFWIHGSSVLWLSESNNLLGSQRIRFNDSSVASAAETIESRLP